MRLELTLNEEAVAVEIEPGEKLPSVLRRLGMKGVRTACGQGHCGSCTILLDGRPVRSCLLFAGQVAGRSVTTIEALARGGALHPIQEAFLEESAVQCGFCTPGMILAAKALLDGNNSPSEEEIRESLSGNICRCTGYGSIVRAVKSAAQKLREERR